jgi:hypothetical protein
MSCVYREERPAGSRLFDAAAGEIAPEIGLVANETPFEGV